MVGLPREKKRTRKFNRDGRETKTNNFKKKRKFNENKTEYDLRRTKSW